VARPLTFKTLIKKIKDKKMKKFGMLIILLMVAALAQSLTNPVTKHRFFNGYGLSGNASKDNVFRFCQEVETRLDAQRTVVVADVNVVTITADDSEKVFVSEGIADTNEVYFVLPTAAAGLKYTFVDANATAAKDLWITAATGDKINGGTAGKSYKCTGDAVKQSVTIVARDGVNWDIVSELGTWLNDNN